MRTSSLTREEALALLRNYNKEPFHIQHGITVEYVMRWYAGELGYKRGGGLLGGSRACSMDIDFEQYPQEHCRKAPELLREGGVGEDMIRTGLFPRLRHLQRY